MKTIFSIRIKEIRQGLGLSMADFAKELNVKKSRVNMWENGNSIPHTDMLIAISQKYGVTIDYMVGNEIHI